MLQTRERALLLETLRPPVGYSLDRAIGTSYTLDLHALLVAPLAFTFFHCEDESGSPTADPIALLEALRRHAEHITIFCQAGAISVPKPRQMLLAFLETSVVQVRAPRDGGIFHPKIWLVRFVAEGQPVRYRFLCLSRNLTFHRAWDTCLTLDGELKERRRNFARNRPLAELIAALPGLATQRPLDHVVQRAQTMAAEVPYVDFELPVPFEELAFHPLGLDSRSGWPFPPSRRCLAVTPYLTEWAVRRLSEKHALEVLVSRPESLEAVPAALLPKEGTYVLSAAARLDAQVAEEAIPETPSPTEGTTADEIELTGLHAKIFLFEDGGSAHLFVGSANATSAAFQRNVELLVQLSGRRKNVGIAALLGDSESGHINDSLGSLLQPYVPPPQPEPIDEVQAALDRDAQRLAAEVAAAGLQVTVETDGADALFDLHLVGTLPLLPAESSLRVWPSTLTDEWGRDVAPGGAIDVQMRVTFEAISAFWGFQLELRREGRSAIHRFVAWFPLLGAPADRRERILRSLLKDSKQVLRLLLLLLSREEFDTSILVEGEGSRGGRWSTGAGWATPTLLEALLECLSRDPRQVDRAARLIEDLQRTPEGRELLPRDLDAIWQPIWLARTLAGKVSEQP